MQEPHSLPLILPQQPVERLRHFRSVRVVREKESSSSELFGRVWCSFDGSVGDVGRGSVREGRKSGFDSRDERVLLLTLGEGELSTVLRALGVVGVLGSGFRRS